MRGSILVSLGLAVAACGQQGTMGAKEPPLRWETFTDGSKITRGEAGGTASLVRCWKVESNQSCVIGYDGQWRNVRKAIYPTLPDRIPEETTPDRPVNGYDCDVGAGVTDGYQEHISNQHGQLKEHVVSTLLSSKTEDSWSESYVNDFFKANAVKPQYVWFNCAALYDKMNGNSLASMASTSVDRLVLEMP